VRKYFFMFILSVLIVALQQSFVAKFNILNVGFDLVFVFIVCFSLIRNEIESVAFALICGIMRDSFFPSVFGVNTVIYLISSYILSQIEKRIYKDAIIIPMLLTFSLTILKTLLYFSYFYIASIKFDFKNHVTNVLILESIFNCMASLIVYRFVKRISLMKVMQHDWKF
jgi:rod shape-determining protein MreD